MKIRLLNILGVAFILTSCVNKDGEIALENNWKQEQIIKASAIIEYTNKVIEESNHISKWARTNEKKLAKLIEIARKPSLFQKSSNLTFFMNNSFFLNYEVYNPITDTDIRKVSDLMDETDQTYFSENATLYYTSKNGLRRTYNYLQTYVEQEYYKDDKGKMGKVYADSIGYHFLTMCHTIERMVDKAVDLGETAELLTLEDSPSKEIILLMREQMKLCEELIENYKVYEKGEQTKDSLAALYNQYIEVTDSNTNKGELLELSDSKRNKFNNFLKKNSQLSECFKNLNRSVQADEKLEASTLSSCNTYYQALIENYNKVIK